MLSELVVSFGKLEKRGTEAFCQGGVCANVVPRFARLLVVLGVVLRQVLAKNVWGFGTEDV